MSTETPETNAKAERIIAEYGPNNGTRFQLMSDHARSLERRNAELTAELEDLRQFKKEVDGEGVVPATRVLDKERQVSELTARIAELEKERAEMEKTLPCGFYYDESLPNRMRIMVKQWREYPEKLAEARKDSARIQKLWAIGRKHADKDGDWRVCFSKHHTDLRSAIDMTPDPEIGFWPATPLPETKDGQL